MSSMARNHHSIFSPMHPTKGHFELQSTEKLREYSPQPPRRTTRHSPTPGSMDGHIPALADPDGHGFQLTTSALILALIPIKSPIWVVYLSLVKNVAINIQ